MSLDAITAVLLPDGWHDVVPGTLNSAPDPVRVFNDGFLFQETFWSKAGPVDPFGKHDTRTVYAPWSSLLAVRS